MFFYHRHVLRHFYSTTTKTRGINNSTIVPPSILALHDRARALDVKRTIVLPEGGDERMQKAAAMAVELGLANILVLDDTGSAVCNLPSHIQVLHPRDHPRFQELTHAYCLRRARKKFPSETFEQASDSPTYAKDLEQASSSLYFGNLLVRDTDECDGSVAGAVNSSGGTVSAAIKVLGLDRGVSTLSSFFIMSFPETEATPLPIRGKTKIFADCAVVVAPDSEQLAEIAIHAAKNAVRFLPEEEGPPRIGLLSFSTKGSSNAEEATIVRQALDCIHRRKEDNGIATDGCVYDGELQLDAAILPHVASSKAPGSDIGGDANVLVFPNLGAGNIGYKMAERMAGAVAVGPILQGLAHPANDLSRGCTTEDILDVIAVTALQSVAKG
jgi:phosphate acetyltransferase